MGLQVIMSGDDSETCYTLHPKQGRKLSTSLAIEQTRPRFAKSQVCKSGNSLLLKFVPEKSLGVSKRHRKARWMQRRSLFGQLVCRLVHFHECRNEMRFIGERTTSLPVQRNELISCLHSNSSFDGN
ncbi:hypothetical protein TNCV_591941 [Trichonephila clavipes]|nr:hypothetical protein TNCV_591941 [Trichonephila clavipes]